jgi:hypothetical protein
VSPCVPGVDSRPFHITDFHWHPIPASHSGRNLWLIFVSLERREFGIEIDFVTPLDKEIGCDKSDDSRSQHSDFFIQGRILLGEESLHEVKGTAIGDADACTTMPIIMIDNFSILLLLFDPHSSLSVRPSSSSVSLHSPHIRDAIGQCNGFNCCHLIYILN